VASGPICAPIACVRSTVAPASTTVSSSVVSGPITAPVATVVAPCNCEF
jgi:hypothetical protein